MPYTAPTFAEAKAALASRLNDPQKVHWTDEELGVYLVEAERTWNAWTAHWRDRVAFTTTQNEAFYDLPTVLPTLRAQTVTNWDLIRSMQYKLIEPVSPTTWAGSAQFTLEQLINAIQRRRDLFLQETGAVLTRTQTAYAFTPQTGRIDLDESVLTVRRAAWRPTATQFLRPLMRSDDWAAVHYTPAWPSSTRPPNSYAVSTTPPLKMQLIPPGGQAAGTLDLLSVSRGTSIQDPFTEVSLGVPDDFAWVVEYGALADVLNGDGLALDPQRAAYCETRWEQGIAMAKKAPVVLNAGIQE